MKFSYASFLVGCGLNHSFGFIETIPVYISGDLAHLIILQDLIPFGLEIQKLLTPDGGNGF